MPVFLHPNEEVLPTCHLMRDIHLPDILLANWSRGRLLSLTSPLTQTVVLHLDHLFLSTFLIGFDPK